MHSAGFLLRRAGAALALLASALLASGCAGLPRDVQKTASQALPAAAAAETALGRIARASTEDPALSGFRLMSWSEQAFATRLELIARAERTLDLQYYILEDDDTGRMLLRALRDAAGRGVRIRLLLDDLYIGSGDPLLLGLAAHPNVEVRLFNPFMVRPKRVSARFAASLFDVGRLNHRMHNKLFIADGAMAIAGGRNIGDEYFMAHEGANYIDLDVFAVGELLPTLGRLFDQYWNSEHVFPIGSIVQSSLAPAEQRQRFETATLPRPGRGSQPPPAGAKDILGQLGMQEEIRAGRLKLIWAPAQAFADSPDKIIAHSERVLGKPVSTDPTVRQSLMSALLLARHDVLISSPYMVPDRSVMDDITEGRLWGLPITVITNSLASTDEPFVHAGYQRYRAEMVDLGVKVYEVAPSPIRRSSNLGSFGRSIGRFHAKAAAIDGELMFIGSLNFDPRSENHNTELGLLINSPELTGQLLKLAEVVMAEASFRVRLGPDRKGLVWELKTADGEQTFTEEPDTGWWRRAMLWLVGPFVPEGQL
ncbi:MAG: phospholipase D family protein [Burkholderiales bacterium]|nr:phospholipase D family protein [Burkholderiales bacterium]